MKSTSRILVLLCAFVSCSLVADGQAFSLRDFGTKVKQIVEPYDIGRLSQLFSSHHLEMSQKVDRLLEMMERTQGRLDRLEQKMELSSRQPRIAPELTTPVTKKDKRNSLEDFLEPELTSTIKPIEPESIIQTIDLTPLEKLIETTHNQTTDRITALETTLLHAIKQQGIQQVDRDYLKQLHSETNEICRQSIKNLEIPLSIAPSGGAQPLSPVMGRHIEVLAGQVKKLSENVEEVHYEVTKGKMEKLESALEKIRALVADLVHELEFGNLGNKVNNQNQQLSKEKENDDQIHQSDIYGRPARPAQSSIPEAYLSKAFGFRVPVPSSTAKPEIQNHGAEEFAHRDGIVDDDEEEEDFF